jgi:hypothetical protein
VKKWNKMGLTALIVVALGLLVTGVIGALIKAPQEGDTLPTYEFKQEKELANLGAFNAVKIDSDQVDIKLKTAEIANPKIYVNGNFYRDIKSVDEVIEANVRQKVLCLSFNKALLIQDLMILGFDIGELSSGKQSVQAEVILPQQAYRWLKVDSYEGDIDVNGVNGYLDLESESGDIVISSEDEQPLIDAETELGDIVLQALPTIDQSHFMLATELGKATLFGQAVNNSYYDKYDKYDDEYDDNDRYEKTREKIKLESELGNIEVRALTSSR